jgi:glyoxylase-like metal-dependent hydrolase (beta-lactamase superfamily II)
VNQLRSLFAVGTLLVSLSAIAAERFADRLYVMPCGQAHAPDQSRWSPGVNVGKPLDLSDNCYLIRHDGDWMIWDTGIADSVADHPEGVKNESTGITWKRGERLSASLARIGLRPSDIRYVGISHSHPDHIGNVELFPNATLLIQATEYNWPQPDGSPRYAPGHPVMLLDGDFDVFGDGSVVILSTPGHTPGHQSLEVKLHTVGNIVLSGDAVHFYDNWVYRRTPSMNVDAAQTQASMEKIADVLKHDHAQLWINHDLPQSTGQRHVPEFYE